jgi:hypothetical protein
MVFGDKERFWIDQLYGARQLAQKLDSVQVRARDGRAIRVEKRGLIGAEEFWASEYLGGLMPPQNLEDLIIYECSARWEYRPPHPIGTWFRSGLRRTTRWR